MSKRLSLEGNTLVVRESGGKSTILPLDDLRLVFMVSYFDFKWNFFINRTRESVSILDLDALSPEKQASVFQTFRELLGKGGKYELGKVHLCLADFTQNSTSFTLFDIKSSGIDPFDSLANACPARQKKRTNWLAGNPQVELVGGGRNTAIVDKAGFRVGKKFIPWEETATVKIEISDNGLVKAAHLLVVPQGVSTGAFSMKQYKYALRFIKKNMVEVYYAECTFWRNLCAEKDRESPLTEKLTTLKDLWDQGVISEEKYQQAKAKALEELT
jgi:hypothetical protein